MPKELGTSDPERRYFERGATLLKECIENQRISFAKGMESHLEDSLLRVRMLPNGRLNLDTVDEMVRSTFHMLASDHFKQMYEAKE